MLTAYFLVRLFKLMSVVRLHGMDENVDLVKTLLIKEIMPQELLIPLFHLHD